MPVLPRSPTLPLALLAAAVLGFLGTLVRSDDPDMFHHLAFGREILASGFPSTEPFLYPLRGEPAGAPPYWLGSVVIYLSHAALGDAGLSLLPAAIGAALAVVLLLDSTPRGGSHSPLSLAAAAAPIALALETYRYRAVARTEIFAALLLAWTMWAVRRYEDGRPRALLAFPLVAVLWTNLHPSTAIALVPLAIALGAGAVQRLLAGAAASTPAPRWRELAPVGAVLVAGLGASLLTPSPVNPIVLALRIAAGTLGLPDMGGAGGVSDTAVRNVVATVGELRGGGAALWSTPVGALIAVAALAFALRWRTVRPRELATVAAFAILPFVAVRFAMFFAIVAAPIAARRLGELAAALPEARGWPARSAAGAVLAAAAVATLPLGALAPHIGFGAGLTRGTFPVRGADYLEASRFDGRLFNTFHFGGYLEWRRLGPPFQDGRGATRAEDAAGAMAGPLDPSAFSPLDARYRFDALLVAYPGRDPVTNPGAPLGIFHPDRATWALVAFDDVALLYLRRDGRHAELAARDEFRVVTPANPVLTTPRDPLASLAEYRRSVREAPDCFRCRFFLGEHELAYGSADDARRVIAPALHAATGPERDVIASLSRRIDAALQRRASARPPPAAGPR